MRKIRSVIFVVAITMFLVVAVALSQMKTTTTARGLAEIKAQTHTFSLVTQENEQAAADEANARTDASASADDKVNNVVPSNGTTVVNGTSSNSTVSSLTAGATSNDITLTSKGNTTVNTTGEMPKTGENDTALFAILGVSVVAIIAFARAKSVRVK